MAVPPLIPWAERLRAPAPTPLRTVFMGTPEFAVPSLTALSVHPDVRVQLVVSQPDRPAGRGRRLQAPAVARQAADLNLPLRQPERVRELREELHDLAPDLLVVAAYGKILPRWLLELPRIGPLNLHASLLPRHRGAAPIQAAILAGDERAGVCLMGMEPALDAGPVLLRAAVPLTGRETAGSLTEALATLAGETTAAGVDGLVAGTLHAEPQDDAQATYAPKVTPEQAWIDWSVDVAAVDRLVRAMQPAPGARTTWRGETLKIHAGTPQPGPTTAPPGAVVAVAPTGIDVACADGAFRLSQLQAPGKRAVAAADFLRGHELAVGERLGATGRA